jgi:hypothetical protein
MKILARHRLAASLLTLLVAAAVLAGCGNKETGKALTGPLPSFMQVPSLQPVVKPAVQPALQPVIVQPVAVQPAAGPPFQPTLQPKPTRSALDLLLGTELDIRAGPNYVPLELYIPALKIYAPMLGVGLTVENVMDAPQGPLGDPVWHTAFWYRGGGIPGEPGTATIGGHVNDPNSNPEIFAHLQDLRPGDQIILHIKDTDLNIRFTVDQVKEYSTQETSDPAVLTQIYGAGPVAGTGARAAPDGLSHLTLITCAGAIVNHQFDHRTVVYATLSK